MAAPERLSATEMAKLYTNYASAQAELAKIEAEQITLRDRAVEIRKELATFNGKIKSAARGWTGDA